MENKNTITELLAKNKKALLKEVKQSKELFYLIKKSTKEELTTLEKEKVKLQLLDVFKSIPALAIFLLPGGLILLPIALKFIPQLLPSSFYEEEK